MPAPTHTYDPWQLIVEVRELPGAGGARPRSPHLPRSAQTGAPGCAAHLAIATDAGRATGDERPAASCGEGRARAREDRWA